MDYLEQGMSGLTDLMDRFAKEIRIVSEEAIGATHKPSSDELRRKVAEAQDRIAREASEIFGRLEQELETRLNEIREMIERVVLLKELVHWTVGHGKTASREVTPELIKERLKRESY
ncbi:MAG: hypothetical protein ACE5K9_03740 [Candidatus Methylomirabilales bacterium]